MSDLRDKAVEAAWGAYSDPGPEATERDELDAMRYALAAAEPFIREDERRRIIEALRNAGHPWSGSPAYRAAAADIERMGEP